MTEDQPLLRPGLEETRHGCEEESEFECSLDFHPNGDSDNPREWPTAYKWSIVLLLACMAFTVYEIPYPGALPLSFLHSCVDILGHEPKRFCFPLLTARQDVHLHLGRPRRWSNRRRARRRPQ